MKRSIMKRSIISFEKQIILSVLLLFCALSASGQGYLEKSVHIWGEFFSTNFVVDGQGNLFLTGTFEGPVYVGSEDNLISPFDSSDSFIMKFDSTGETLWNLMLTGAGAEDIWDFDVDEEGYCYFLGNFDQTLQFDDVDLDVGYQGEDFLARLDRDGKLSAMRRGTENGRRTSVKSIALNSAGKLCVTGYHDGTAPFGEERPDYPEPEDDDYYQFLCLMDNEFNVIWNISVLSWVGAAEPDLEDNILFTGKISSSLVLPDTTITASQSLFLGKLDPDGNLIWIKTYGTSEHSGGFHKVFVDSKNNAYFIGEGEGSFYFPDTTAASQWSAVIAKFNEEGEYLWSIKPDLRFYTYVVDSKGFLYASYYSSEPFTSEEGFVIFDPEGNMVFKQVFEEIEILGLSIGNQGEIFYYGTFSDDIIIDDELLTPGSGKNSLMGRLKTAEMIAAGGTEQIRQAEQNAGSFLYPNPATKSITVRGDGKVKITVYEIYSIAGSLLRSGTPEGNVIELPGLKPGVYMIRVKTSEGPLTEKLIIY